MSSKTIYDAISRVVNEEKEVIGFMVKSKNNRMTPIFMSIEVLTFGLANKTFEVANVKLGGNGKPRGCNGFLLSKLPIEILGDSEEIFTKLIEVLNYIIKDMIEDNNVKYNKVTNGVTATYTATFYSSDYVDISIDLAERELNQTLRYYQRHLPKELKLEMDEILGSVSDKGLISISVKKSLLKCEK